MDKANEKINNSSLIFLCKILFWTILPVILLLSPPRCLYGEEPIINGLRSMETGKSQVLSLMNYRTGEVYEWGIVKGVGMLSASSGEKVLFTAPSEDVQCDNMPVIRVTDSVGNWSEIRISVSGEPLPERTMAYKKGRVCTNGELGDRGRYYWSCATKAYDCNGNYIGLTAPSAGCWSGREWGCGASPDWCDHCIGEDEIRGG